MRQNDLVDGSLVSANTTDNETECVIHFPACFESEVEFIGYMYIDAPLNFLGIVTNILNLLVLTKPPFMVRVTAFTFLRGMAVADLLACSFIFPIGFCRCFPPGDISWKGYMQQFYDVYIYLPLANWCGCVSTWITVASSLERFMCVAFVVKSRQFWTPSRARLIVFVIFAASFLLNMPYFFLTEIQDTPPPQYTDWGLTDGASAYFWCRSVFTKIIPITLVLVLNTLLLKNIWAMNKRHDEMKSKMEQPSGKDNIEKPKTEKNSARAQMQMRATLMVVSISIVFLVCHSLEPFSHSSIFSALFGKCNVYGTNHRIFIIYTNAMETVTLATNFFFYCLFNKQFWSVLKGMCCCKNFNNQVQDVTITLDS